MQNIDCCSGVFEEFNLKRCLLDLDKKHGAIGAEYDELYFELTEKRKRDIFAILIRQN